MSAKNRIIPIFIPHLGCPHDCVFCNQKRISGSLLPAAAQDVALSVEAALGASSEPMELAFYGGSFTALPAAGQEELLKAAQPFLASGRISGIRLSTRPDAISAQILELLRRYGVSTVELGAQSMDDAVLRRSGRGHTADDTRAAAGLIKAAGFSLVLQMMTGLPGSSDETDAATARALAELEPDGVRIYPAVVIRDTALYDLWRSGEYREHTVGDAVRVCARILPVFEEKGIAIIRLGLNPTDDLSGGDAAAGAYHPALGELVRSRVLLERAQGLLRGVPEGSKVVLGVHKSQISQMIGQRRGNIGTLCRSLSLSGVRVIESDVKIGEILVVAIAKDD